MIEFGGSILLLDIEGTTASVAFVYDVMFPFVRRNLADFLDRQSDQAEVQAACDLLAIEAGHSAGLNSIADGHINSPVVRNWIVQRVAELMDADSKSTALKAIQGLIWKNGFHSGELIADVFPDVLPAIQAWKKAGRRVCIYSSGSIQAQKLFFGHTRQGDFLPWLDGHFDTTIGHKKVAESYTRIAAELGVVSDQILFVSDIAGELEAAEQAGMHVVLACRPGNSPVPDTFHFPRLSSFDEIKLVGMEQA